MANNNNKKTEQSAEITIIMHIYYMSELFVYSSSRASNGMAVIISKVYHDSGSDDVLNNIIKFLILFHTLSYSTVPRM